MNMAILTVWTLFVLIPQFVMEPSIQKHYLPCIHRNDTYSCHRNTTVSLLPANCSAPREATLATLCANDTATVITVPRSVKLTCNITLQEWYQCPADTPSFGNLVDLVTGRGGYSDTVLFLGHYSNLTRYNGVSYNRPVAILVCTGVVYTISFIMLIIRSVLTCMLNICVVIHACASRYTWMYACRLIQLGKKLYQRQATQTDFCSKVFGSWDFGVVSARTTALRKKSIRRDLLVCICHIIHNGHIFHFTHAGRTFALSLTVQL